MFKSNALVSSCTVISCKEKVLFNLYFYNLYLSLMFIGYMLMNLFIIIFLYVYIMAS